MSIVPKTTAGRKSNSAARPSRTLRRDNAPSAPEPIVFDLINFGEEFVVEVMTEERWAAIPPAERPDAAPDRTGQHFIIFTMK